MSFLATKIRLGIAAAALSLAALTTAASAEPLKLGQLDCDVVPNSRSNLIISSTALVDCSFNPTVGSPTYYRGETGIGLGIDLSVKTDDRFSFIVLTAQSAAPNYNSYPLAGKYYGAEATVSLGAGLGAKVLVGGSAKQFSLAPIGGQATRGTGISAGAGYLFLQAAR